MIQLTRLNNQALVVNSDLIKFVESAPDTVLTLVSGEKVVVRETPDQVLDRIVRFRHMVLEGTSAKPDDGPEVRPPKPHGGGDEPGLPASPERRDG